MYSARWAAASDLEKKVVAVMAGAGGMTVTRAEIAAALSDHPGAEVFPVNA